MRKTGLDTAAAAVRKLEFSEEEVEKLKAELLRMALTATIIVRSPERSATGGVKYVEIPDNAIRLAATARALEHAVGKPRQSLAIEAPAGDQGNPGVRDLVALMQAQPAVCGRILAAFQDSLKTGQAIDVTASSATKPALPAESKSGGSPS